jgi:hypothetical protein
MLGDPKECRQHALNCMLLAKQATDAIAKDTFLNLAQAWARLAVELEQAEAVIEGAVPKSEGDGA